MKKVIFDIDGVLADNSHRLHFIKDGNKDWDSFFNPAAMASDKLIESAAIIMDGLSAHYGLEDQKEILFFTGRTEKTRDVTKAWLEEYLISEVSKEQLFMRPDGDYRPDDVLKEEWLLQVGPENVLCAFEDRSRIVAMYRKHGVVCYQAAEGDF